MESSFVTRAIRGLLALGSLVFALSAVALLIMPSAFATLLGLTPTSELDWALRMMGAVLVALAGQMWLVRHTPDPSTRGAAAVMVIGGGLMTIMTVWLPGEWSTLRWAYLGFGLGFCLLYLILLLIGLRDATAVVYAEDDDDWE
ncbi:MAG: hypothetical protein F2836_03150 [Actinobacteria bacterium]|uniref:Unannotated protein n=1 Tax=freshwater metagenome TaxID=449393 RepID=A0A6J7IER6_9ZZZZ|nr:hypothetical protein [Actinomycetota bacterium]